jgi:TetR/AcrR family fatty acid metabolism transcriptional regulator
MENAKKNKILNAATKIFAEKGYQYATVSDIGKEAGIATGLIYSYFENKLDLLLSIVLLFWRNINHVNQEKLKIVNNPYDKLIVILHNFEDLLIKNGKELYLIKVLNEALPHMVAIKEKKLKEKRQGIFSENKNLFNTIDKIITEGQKKGVFDNSLKPSVLRQTLFGSIETLIYGLFFETYSQVKIGYNRSEAHKAAVKLIKKFICK